MEELMNLEHMRQRKWLTAVVVTGSFITNTVFIVFTAIALSVDRIAALRNELFYHAGRELSSLYGEYVIREE